MNGNAPYGITRRSLLKAGATLAGSSMVWPLTSFGKSEQPIKIGMVDPQTGTYAITGSDEIRGAKLAVDQINKHNGILGRPVQLLIEDSAADPGLAVQKARKLINRNHVSFLIGTVSSAVSLAVQQATHDMNALYVDSGGHTDPVTGKKCTWNTFRTCSTTWELAAGVAKTIYDKFGGKWYFITPDYAFGHTEQHAFAELLHSFGGTVLGNALAPLGTTDFSSYLIKAKASNPDVLIVLPNGNDQINCLKQANQFGLQKDMAIAGGLNELEVVASLPKAARIGWWTFEWYWKQPNVPHVADFVNEYKSRYDNKVPTARSWFGFASAHAVALGAGRAKSLAAMKVAKAMEGMELPPEVALQPGKVYYRAGDHQLMANEFPGQIKTDGKYPDLFDVADVVPSDKIAKSAAASGCHMTYPS